MLLQVIVNGGRRVAGWIGLTGLPAGLAPIARGTAVSATGNGLWFTVWALYLTRQVHLGGEQVGVAMGVAGLVGFLAPLPLGRLADRRGPREVYRALLFTEAVVSIAFAFCTDLWEVMAVAAAVAACAQGGVGVSASLVTELAGDGRRIDALARTRACSHAGQAIGAALGAIVIALDSRAGYLAAIAFNALTFLVFAVDIGRVPSVAPRPAARVAPGLGAVRDLPYATLAAICGVLTLCWGLMSTGLPLWISADTNAPRATTAVIVFCSAVAIALMQVSFSRGHDTPAAAVRAARRSGVSLAVCCGLLAVASGPPALAATGLLLCAGAMHIAGELWYVAASRGLSVPLMDPERPAEYQSVFAAGEALAIMLAPALMTTLVIPNRTAGWVGLGTLFVAAGLAARPAAAWAARERRAAADAPSPVSGRASRAGSRRRPRGRPT